VQRGARICLPGFDGSKAASAALPGLYDLAVNRAAQLITADDIAEIQGSDLPWRALSGCRVAVTGASGFIGSYFARTLLELHPAGLVNAPVEVLAVVRNQRHGEAVFADQWDNENFHLVEWDLRTLGVPELGDVHYVLHAASQASPIYYERDPVGTMLPNTIGTAALLEALRRSHNPRGLLFVSSGEVNGAVESELIGESDYGVLDPTTLRACYSEGKRAAETLCVAWTHQHDLPTYIARLGHTYGPGLSAEDGRVFADFAYNVARGENIVMKSDGSARRGYCYVSDAVAGLFTVLLKGAAATPYNISNPRTGELSVLELAELLTAMYPEKHLSVDRTAREDEHYLPSPYSRIVLDTAELERLGWQPHIEPGVGFRRMIDAISGDLG
jgi:dTDP-glucose 4,6-dehydratase